MVVGNHQCNAANLNQHKAQFQLELSLAQFSPSLFILQTFLCVNSKNGTLGNLG